MKSIPAFITRPKSNPGPKRFRRAVLGLLLPALLLPGTAPASQVPTSMRVAMVVPEDMELYPLRVMDRDAVSLFDLVYESLVELDDDRVPQPSLASSWESSPDGKTWRFTIRQNVYFHDGRVLTAHDVASTMTAIQELAQNESLTANEKGLYCNLVNVASYWKAEDDHTLTVTAKNAGYGLLYAMTFPVLQSQSLRDVNPPGTGPYRLDAYTPGDRLWLSGNENWWDRPPHISEIVGVWYPDVDEALAAFDAEEVDILMTRSPAAVRYRGATSSRTDSYTYSTRQLECLLFNHASRKYDLSEAAVRQAIAYAIDKTRLASGIYQGIVTQTDTIQSSGSWLYNTDTNSYPSYAYDRARADALLDGAGWSLRDEEGYRFKRTDSGDVTLSLRLNYYDEPGNTLRKEAASEIAGMLEAVGIRVQVFAYSFENAQNKLNVGDYELFLCAFQFDIVPDPGFLLTNNLTTNLMRYRSEDTNKFCQELRKAVDQSDFQQAWFDIQRCVAIDAPLLPLYWRNGVMLTRYPFSAVRDIREYELLRSIEKYR